MKNAFDHLVFHIPSGQHACKGDRRIEIRFCFCAGSVITVVPWGSEKRFHINRRRKGSAGNDIGLGQIVAVQAVKISEQNPYPSPATAKGTAIQSEIFPVCRFEIRTLAVCSVFRISSTWGLLPADRRWRLRLLHGSLLTYRGVPVTIFQ